MAAGDIYYTPVVAKLRRTTSQSINNNAWTAIQFDAEDADNYNGHSITSNTDQFVVPKTGLYMVTGSGNFIQNATGLRGVRFSINGTSSPDSSVLPTCATDLWAACIATVLPLNVNDVLRLEVLQTSGGALNSNGNTPGFADTLGLTFLAAI